MKFPVFDLHCDTVLGLLGHDFSASGSLAENNLHIDLKRARDLAGYVQCFACFTTTAEAPPEGRTVEDVFERELSVLVREFNANENVIKQAFTAEDIDANTEAGIMSAVLSIEGPAGFGFDPALLENLSQKNQFRKNNSFLRWHLGKEKFAKDWHCLKNLKELHMILFVLP